MTTYKSLKPISYGGHTIIIRVENWGVSHGGVGYSFDLSKDKNHITNRGYYKTKDDAIESAKDMIKIINIGIDYNKIRWGKRVTWSKKQSFWITSSKQKER